MTKTYAYTNKFTVKPNWLGIFVIIVLLCGIIMSFFLFVEMWHEAQNTTSKEIYVVIAFCIPLFNLLLCVWSIIPLLFNRIKVDGNIITIRKAFVKKTIINVSEIISYSNKESATRGRHYFYSSIIFGENSSIDIRNDLFKNYDLLMTYLRKKRVPYKSEIT